VHTLAEATDALMAYVPSGPVVRRPLERTRALLAALGDPQEAVPAAHVAGTSGKTSTAYLLRALLQAGGVRTGLTVSPHVTSITERVQVDGAPLAPELFAARVGALLPLVEAVRAPAGEGAGADGPPGYFEVMTALAHWVFAGSGGRDRPVDLAVLETGIGGRSDRTNTIRRPDKLCLISDVGYDHTELLGDTVEEIAAHKAGIIQPGNHVLVIDQDERVLKIVAEEATERGATLEVVSARAGDGLDLPPFQRRNFSLALAGYRHLGGTPLAAPALAAVARAVPPGRMERVQVAGHEVILDGAHNPQKLAALVEALRDRGIGRLPVLASLLRAPTPKLRAALAELAEVSAELVVPEFTAIAEIGRQTPPATEIAELAREVGIEHVSVVPDPTAGLAELLSRPDPVLLVTGSLYLVSTVRDALGGGA